MPLCGHLDKAFNIFAYPKCHPNSRLAMNIEHIDLCGWFKGSFKDDTEWFNLYDNFMEEIHVD